MIPDKIKMWLIHRWTDQTVIVYRESCNMICVSGDNIKTKEIPYLIRKLADYYLHRKSLELNADAEASVQELIRDY